MGIEYLNIELTTACNKSCPFCVRVEARDNNELKIREMSGELLDLILSQYKGSIIQFHRNGEPLLYSGLRELGEKCKGYITNIVTNGKLLMERKDDLKYFTSITVSVYEGDVNQIEQIKSFNKQVEKPMLLVKLLGDYDNLEFDKLGIKTLKRSIHNPTKNNNYRGSLPPIPELGICLDFLMKPSIDVDGNVFICNRYDPLYKGMLGNIKKDSLDWIWNVNPLRLEWLELHKKGKRNEIPLCTECHYWGCPTNG